MTTRDDFRQDLSPTSDLSPNSGERSFSHNLTKMAYLSVYSNATQSDSSGDVSSTLSDRVTHVSPDVDLEGAGEPIDVECV